MDSDKKNNKYLKAKQQVADIKKLYSSIMFYIIFISALAALNYYINQWRNPWFLWAALGWGIGIFFQALKVYGWPNFLGKNWEDRQIKKYMEKEDKTCDN